MKKYLLPFFVLAIFTGCNIFSWTWSEEGRSFKYEDYENVFMEHINSGRYEDAMKTADNMIKKDSTRSEGYFFKAKAARYFYFNKYFILQELIKRKQEHGIISRVAEPRSVPFLDLDVFVQESIYVGNRIIKDNLNKIYYEQAPRGRYQKQHIEFDYFLANSVYAILSLRDLTGDGSILSDTSFFKDFAMIMSSKNITMENFDSLFNRVSDNPVVFNDMLNRTSENLEESFNVVSDFSGNNEDNIKKIDSVLTVINGSLESLKIHDSIVNPENIIFN